MGDDRLSDSHADSSLSARDRRNYVTLATAQSGMLSSSGKNPISTFAYHANTISHGSKFIFKGGLLKGAGSFSFLT